jgi:hypothetical protein
VTAALVHLFAKSEATPRARTTEGTKERSALAIVLWHRAALDLRPCRPRTRCTRHDRNGQSCGNRPSHLSRKPARINVASSAAEWLRLLRRVDPSKADSVLLFVIVQERDGVAVSDSDDSPAQDISPDGEARSSEEEQK